MTLRVLLALTALALFSACDRSRPTTLSSDTAEVVHIPDVIIPTLSDSVSRVETEDVALPDSKDVELDEVFIVPATEMMTKSTRMWTTATGSCASPVGVAATSYDMESPAFYAPSTGDGAVMSYSMTASYDATETSNETAYAAGLLTAGEINDFSKWKQWGDIDETDLATFAQIWKIDPHQRYMVTVKSDRDKPVVDAVVKLKREDGTTEWESRTDNTGKAELWAGMFQKIDKTKFSIQIDVLDKAYSIDKAKSFGSGVNTLIVRTPCDAPEEVDIVFAVDATGSMGDEIEYLKSELNDIMGKAKKSQPDLTFNLGSVFYRDHGDEYLVRTSPLKNSMAETMSFIQAQRADGGGDTPEAVDAALEAAMQMNWSKEARTRLLFLVLDAPPHADEEVINRMNHSVQEAARQGIRIIPITASGIDKATEYLMRSLALATNGTYTFLTDDSGIGNPHMAPTTDHYDVELLNDLILRLITQYTFIPPCDEVFTMPELTDTTTLVLSVQQIRSDTSHVTDPIDPGHVETDVQPWLRFYPNPTRGPLVVEVSEGITEFYLADVSGKLIERFYTQGQTRIQLDLSSYTSGIYFICSPGEKKNISGKVILAM